MSVFSIQVDRVLPWLELVHFLQGQLGLSLALSQVVSVVVVHPVVNAARELVFPAFVQGVLLLVGREFLESGGGRECSGLAEPLRVHG